MCYHSQCTAGCRYGSLSVSGSVWLSLPPTLDANDLLICCRNEIYQFKHPKARHWTTVKDNIHTHILWLFECSPPHVRSLILWFFTLSLYRPVVFSLKCDNRRWYRSQLQSIHINSYGCSRVVVCIYIAHFDQQDCHMKHLINNCSYAEQFPHHVLQTYLCQCRWSITCFFWSVNEEWRIPLMHIWMRKKPYMEYTLHI